MSSTPATLSAPPPPRRAPDERRRRVQRARNFFIIAVLAALVSVAGHCLPGDAPAAGPATSQTRSGR